MIIESNDIGELDFFFDDFHLYVDVPFFDVEILIVHLLTTFLILPIELGSYVRPKASWIFDLSRVHL